MNASRYVRPVLKFYGAWALMFGLPALLIAGLALTPIGTWIWSAYSAYGGVIARVMGWAPIAVTMAIWIGTPIAAIYATIRYAMKQAQEDAIALTVYSVVVLGIAAGIVVTK